MIFDEMMESRRLAEANGAKFEVTLEEQIEEFEMRIGMTFDSTAAALEAHKAYLEERGIEWNDTPVSQIPELADRMEDGGLGEYMGGSRGR